MYSFTVPLVGLPRLPLSFLFCVPPELGDLNIYHLPTIYSLFNNPPVIPKKSTPPLDLKLLTILYCVPQFCLGKYIHRLGYSPVRLPFSFTIPLTFLLSCQGCPPVGTLPRVGFGISLKTFLVFREPPPTSNFFRVSDHPRMCFFPPFS